MFKNVRRTLLSWVSALQIPLIKNSLFSSLSLLSERERLYQKKYEEVVVRTELN
jgi:hypothetical protein